MGSTVHPLAAASAALLAKRYRVPFVFEIRDLWPETLVQIGNIDRGHPLIRLLAALEKWLVSAASAIVTTMPDARRYLATIGVPDEKVTWVSNGVDPSRFPETPRPEGPTPQFLYFGSLGAANGMDNLIEGFAQAQKQLPMRLRIVGGGADRERLEELAVRLGVAHVVDFEGYVPREHIPTLAAEASAFVACTLPIPLYEYGISLNKIFEYLAAGRPILFGGQSRGNPIAASSGVLVAESTPEGLAHGFLAVAQLSPEDSQAWAAANRAMAASQFSFDALGEKFSTVLKTVASDGGTSA